MTRTAAHDQVIYLYGVVAGDLRLRRSELARLEAIRHSALAGIVERVPARDFGSETLEQRLQDIGWLAPLARKHAGVLEDVMAYATVIPVPLCTLFRSRDSLRESLVANERRLRALLTSLDGRQEWGLKISCDAPAIPGAIGGGDPDLRALERALTAATPGKAYILRKQHDRRADRLRSERIEQVVHEALDLLDTVAVDSRLRPVPAPTAFEAAETMVLNASFLVDDAAASGLHAAAAGLAERFGREGFAFDLTGPWPPYSFCGDIAATCRPDAGEVEE